MTDAVTLAVDVGTSLVKAVAVTDDGVERAVVSRPAEVDAGPGGRSEQDMDGALATVLAVVREAAGRAAAPVARIALTAQGDGAWLVDARARPTGPAALWNDARAAEVVDRWQRDGTLDAAFRIDGALGNLGLPDAILAWSAEHDPSTLEGAEAVLTCGSWLYLCLTGVLGLHPSEASAPWLDVRSGTVSDELFVLRDLEWARPLVPPVLDAERLTAPLGGEIAAACGAPAGIPVTLAPYDVVASAVGSGATSVGDAFCILGTTLCTGLLLAEPDTSGEPSGLTLRGLDGDPVIRAFPTLAGTGVVEWTARTLGLADARALTELAASAPPGSHGVRMLPYLSPAGERAPFLDPSASGLLGGLGLDTTPADIARASIEGLAHVIRDCLDAGGPRPERLVLSGGGSASMLWCRIVADTTGVPVVRGDGAQLGARGALAAALVADGSVRDTGEAIAGMGLRTTTIDPDPTSAALADERHSDFLATRAAISARWDGWRRDRG